MAYEPKKRDKKTVWIITVLIVASLFMMWFMFTPEKEKLKDEYKIGSLTHETTVEKLSKEYKETYLVSDYFYYGESLNLLHDSYRVEESDVISGKSLILKDVLSDQEFAFVLGSTIDRQILLNRLKTGYYEVFLIENLVEKRVVFDEEVDSSITTITQSDGKRYRINVLAGKEYYKEKGIHLKDHYVFIEVKEEKEKVYDIALDPAAYDRDFTYVVNKGSEGYGLSEYIESYKACELLKQKLEAYGLKVLIVRDHEEALDSYGEDGRLARAYQSKAKYYFRIGFSESLAGYRGMDITYSGHSSEYLAQQIMYQMKRLSDVEICEAYGIDGLIRDLLIKGIDDRYVYDQDLWIREAGGKATLAGTFSNNAKEGTGSFAKGNLYGMNALDITLGYLSNESDATYWKTKQTEYMDALAKAIALSLNIVE